MPTEAIDQIVAAYAFTSEDKHRLIDIMARAYLTAKVNAYHKAQLTARSVYTLKHPWFATAQDVQTAQEWASKRVDGIMATYQERVRAIAEQAVQEDAELQRGLIGGLINAASVIKGVAAGVQAFVGWKSDQIANDAVGSGNDDGTNQFVCDVLDEVGEDSEIADNGVPLANLGVTIQPGHSSSDVCAQYAGETFSLSDYRNLGIAFPAHVGCIHSAEIVVI